MICCLVSIGSTPPLPFPLFCRRVCLHHPLPRPQPVPEKHLPGERMPGRGRYTYQVVVRGGIRDEIEGGRVGDIGCGTGIRMALVSMTSTGNQTIRCCGSEAFATMCPPSLLCRAPWASRPWACTRPTSRRGWTRRALCCITHRCEGDLLPSHTLSTLKWLYMTLSAMCSRILPSKVNTFLRSCRTPSHTVPHTLTPAETACHDAIDGVPQI